MKFTTPEEYAAMHDPVASAEEAFEERAGILEYQAGMSREAAEAAARPIAAKFVHQMDLFALRMNAIRLAARKRGQRR